VGHDLVVRPGGRFAFLTLSARSPKGYSPPTLINDAIKIVSRRQGGNSCAKGKKKRENKQREERLPGGPDSWKPTIHV